MATATLPTPPRVKRSTRAINPCAEPKVQPEPPGSYDVFYGPFDSWINVKNPPAALLPYIPRPAVGDGVTDDTAAIQAMLDFVGLVYAQSAPGDSYSDPATDPGNRHSHPGQPKWLGSQPGTVQIPSFGVLYFPAGTYLISKTLFIFNRMYAHIFGEHPSTTTLKWIGNDWQNEYKDRIADEYWLPFDYGFNFYDVDMLLNDGATMTTIRRLSFDGDSKARIAINMSTSYSHGGMAMEWAELQDIYIQKVACGMQGGGTSGNNDADVPVKRCHFTDIIGVGIVTTHWNALTWIAWDCIFERVGSPQTGAVYQFAGSVHAVNNLFINCPYRDIFLSNTQPEAIRGNVSITTADATLPWGWNQFILAVRGLAMIQGNLLINARTTPSLAINEEGPKAFVDNAFYDSLHVSGDYDPTYRLWMRYYNYEYTAPDPITGTVKDVWYPATYLSGNVYNGRPLFAPDVDDRGASKSWNPFHLEDTSLPNGYIPPNHLNITDAEITQILQATANSPIIQEIRSRMPQCPPRIDPHDTSQVVLTDITTAMSEQTINDTLALVTSNPSVDKVNLIHFSIGWYAAGYGPVVYPQVFPNGVEWAIIGDALLSRMGHTNYADQPFFTFGPGPSPVVRCRIEDISISDNWSYASAALLQFYSADMPGARVFGDFPLGNEAIATITSGIRISGFDNLRARFDHAVSSHLRVDGTGNIHTSDDNTVMRYHFGTIYPLPGEQFLNVQNGGSMHVYDIYKESMRQNINMNGGNGYFVADNFMRFHVRWDLSWQDLIGHLTNFTGHQIWLNVAQTHSVPFVDFPSSSSTTTIWGVFGEYAGQDVAESQAYADLIHHVGIPDEFTASSQLALPGMFGLTTAEGESTPANLQIAGNAYMISFALPFTPETTLAHGINDSENLITVTSNADFLGVAETWISIGGERAFCWWTQGDGREWSVSRGNPSYSHPPGTTVRFFYDYWRRHNACVNFPTTGTPVFTMPDIARDAWRYRPFPLPAKTPKNVTDIVLHRVSFGSIRPYTLNVTKV